MKTHEMKHTKGPWSIINSSWAETTIYGYQQEVVASLSIRGEATEETQQEWEDVMDANARLIAAAPELLEALIAQAQADEAAEKYMARKWDTGGERYADFEQDRTELYNDMKSKQGGATSLRIAALARATQPPTPEATRG